MMGRDRIANAGTTDDRGLDNALVSYSESTLLPVLRTLKASSIRMPNERRTKDSAATVDDIFATVLPPEISTTMV